MSSAVCLIAKNEQRAIKEWLAYQVAIGFDRIYVYDNDSDDATPAIVKHVASLEPRIEYRHWPNAPGLRPQVSAYNDALSKSSDDWLAFFDTDEFLVLRKHASINEYLSSLPSDTSAIAVNWLLFGSSGLTEASDDLVINRFRKCAVTNYAKNNFIKTIVKPSAVESMSVHFAEIKNGIYINGSGHSIKVDGPKTEAVDHDTIYLNHYLLKSRHEFLIKKSRGHASRALDDVGKYHIKDEDVEFWDAHDSNHIENNDMSKYQEEVLKIISSWK